MPTRSPRDAAVARSRPLPRAAACHAATRRAAASPLARLALLATVAPYVVGCASGRPPTAAPAAGTAPGGLPPVPAVRGALDLQVRWPTANASVGPRDSTFVFGSVGSGDATLRIDGTPVPVAANGAFLAFLPVPAADAPRYEFVVARGADTVRRTVPVRVPVRRVLRAEGALVVDSGSVSPGGRLVLRGDERVRVTVRAPRNARVWLVPASAPATARASAVTSTTAGAGAVSRPAAARDSAAAPRAIAMVEAVGAPATPAPDGDVAALWVGDVTARQLSSEGAARARVVVARGADTVSLPIARVELIDAPAPDGAPAARRFVLLGRPPVPPDTDRVIVGRPVPEGTYKWFFLPGTPVELTGARGGSARVRLDQQLEVWVDSGEVVPMPAGWAPPARVAGGARVLPSEKWVDLFVPLAERPPYSVVERGRDVELVLHGTQLSPDILQVVGTATDSLVRQVVWEQEASDRVRIALRLARDPYGYQVLWDAARGGIVLRVRRPPVIADARRPLAGLTIVVDAGHPPGGATGPTGLWEPVAVLPVAERVQALLAERGANVVMTRTTAQPVALGDRPVMARRADADAFVSVHLNALPDGVNPFTANGTSTLFFHQHSEPLARAIQNEMVRRFRIRDLGIHYQNLAVARPAWYPAVLTEGLFLMLPEQEAAMRSPEGREAYARAIVEGMEEYFRGIAAGR